jgi:hypothetical protein
MSEGIDESIVEDAAVEWFEGRSYWSALQAIDRVNRVFLGKPGRLVMDWQHPANKDFLLLSRFIVTGACEMTNEDFRLQTD